MHFVHCEKIYLCLYMQRVQCCRSQINPMQSHHHATQFTSHHIQCQNIVNEDEKKCSVFKKTREKLTCLAKVETLPSRLFNGQERMRNRRNKVILVAKRICSKYKWPVGGSVLSVCTAKAFGKIGRMKEEARRGKKNTQQHV